MSNYHRYSDGGAMSDWGHAMFAKGNPFRVSFYGDNHYIFDGNAPHISTLIDDIKARIMRDVDQGYTDLDEDFYLLGINQSNIDDFLTGYNPADIVNSAESWDNSYLLAVACEVFAINDIYAVILDDGAIVFDESFIKQVEWVESE